MSVHAAGTGQTSDHELAARLATEAGELLLGIRAELAGATAEERKAAVALIKLCKRIAGENE